MCDLLIDTGHLLVDPRMFGIRLSELLFKNNCSENCHKIHKNTAAPDSFLNNAVGFRRKILSIKRQVLRCEF